MAMDLYVNSYGTYIHKVGEMFELELDGKKTKISPKKVRSIIISTHARLTSDVIRLAVDNNIDVVMLNDYGEPYGRFWHSRFGSIASIRRKQIEIFEGNESIDLIKEWIGEKIGNSIEHLKELEYKRHTKVEKIETEITKMREFLEKIYLLEGNIENWQGKVRAYEGNSSKCYYKILSYLIPEPYKFHGRNRRPAKDEFNCMLNYAFGVLYSKVEKALVIAGLDPFVGILHTDNYNKKSLVFDIIEKYRFLANRTVFALFSMKKVNKSHFDKIYGGYSLNKEGKTLLLKSFSEKMDKKKRYHGRNLSNLQIIQHESHNLANSLIIDSEKEGVE